MDTFSWTSLFLSFFFLLAPFACFLSLSLSLCVLMDHLCRALFVFLVWFKCALNCFLFWTSISARKLQEGRRQGELSQLELVRISIANYCCSSSKNNIPFGNNGHRGNFTLKMPENNRRHSRARINTTASQCIEKHQQEERRNCWSQCKHNKRGYRRSERRDRSVMD